MPAAGSTFGLAWCLSEGHAGMESQVLGLAEAMGCETVLKSARLRPPWTHMPPALALPPRGALTADSDALDPPWPDILITCGRRCVGLSIALKRRSGGRIFTVHIQDPHVSPARFDLLAVPAHDRLRGENVIATNAAIHRVTRAKLDAAAARLAPALAHLPRPLVAVLVGGSNRRQRLTPDLVRKTCEQLAALARRHGAGLAVTPSRRTGAENEAILREHLAALPAVVWDGTGENPYFGYLGLADAVVATNDSVSMVSEALSTGKPVHVVEIGGGSRRLGAFHHSLREAGLTRPFTGDLERWSYPPPDDTARVAAEVRRRMAAR
jgi:hypothetical protein